jgi:hypothetical protein
MKYTKPTVNLLQLGLELTAAGIPHRGLGMAADDIHTYTTTGAYQDLPPAARAVLDAHIPAVAKTARQILVEELDAATTVAQVKAAVRKWAAAGE